MSKQRPSTPNVGWLLFFTLLSLSLVAGVAGVVSGQSQQQPDAPTQPQQRPRRVTSSNEQNTPPKSQSNADKPNTPVEVGDDEVLRVDTQLVPVPVVVRDRAGRPVANLRAENFTLYEDGRPQRITNFSTSDAPFEIALLLDTSGSTREDIGLIRRAANLFIEQLRPGDRVAIISFNTKQEEGAHSTPVVEVKSPLTDDRAQLRGALEQLGSSYGTPYYDALERVAQEVFREPPRNEVKGRRALVALTDGVDSSSDAEFEESRARLRQSGVISYFIQVNTEDFVEERLLRDCQDDGRLSLSKVQLQRYRRIYAANADAADYANFCQMGSFERMDISRKLYQTARAEMAQLAKDSGGRTFNALDLRDARQAFAQVAEEIGKLYSLGYYPTNKTRDGSFRQIRVEVRGVPGAQVTAREGYQAPKG